MPINVNGYGINSISARQHHYDGIVRDGLVLHLDAMVFNTVTGTTWYDLSENGNHSTLTNGPTYSNTNNGIISFDGTNDFVTTGNQLDPIAYGIFSDSTSFWTVSSWFKPGTTGAITARGGGTGSSATYVTWTSGTDLFCRLRGGTTLTITSSLNTSLWYNLVITWDGTTAKSYLNSSFVNNIAVGTATKQTNNFTVGAAGSGANVFYDGSVSNVYVYNRALTDTEILLNYNATKWRFGL